MNRTSLNIIFVLVFVLSVVFAFAAGRYVGEYDSRKIALVGLNDSVNSAGVDVFSVLSKAILKLREAKIVEADTVILRYAKLKIPQVLECSKSIQCSKTVGALMPAAEDVEKIRSLEELKN